MLDLAAIAEVWRRGSVIRSWLLDLTAAALRESPDLGRFSGQVSDSGDGRWTLHAAIDEVVGRDVELLATEDVSEEVDAYVHLLHDAMRGDAMLFAREDAVEAQWRVVEPVLGEGTPLFEYEPGTWGPAEAARIAPAGGWDEPVPSKHQP